MNLTIESLRARIDALVGTSLEKDGNIVTHENAERMRAVLIPACERGGIPIPHVYPTWEGGLQAEWTMKGWAAEARFNDAGETFEASLLEATPDDGDTMLVHITSSDDLIRRFREYEAWATRHMPGDLAQVKYAQLNLYERIILNAGNNSRCAALGNTQTGGDGPVIIVASLHNPEDICYVVHPNGLGWLESGFMKILLHTSQDRSMTNKNITDLLEQLERLNPDWSEGEIKRIAEQVTRGIAERVVEEEKKKEPEDE